MNNSKISICLRGYETNFSMDLDAGDISKTAASALQRPYQRRAELASMLRRALKKQKSRKTQKTYWSAFLSSYVSKNANSNTNTNQTV